MPKFEDITIDVKARLDIDQRTAEGCLKLVEIFCNANGMNIIGERDHNGETSYRFEKSIPLPPLSPDAYAAINAIGRKTHSTEK